MKERSHAEDQADLQARSDKRGHAPSAEMKGPGGAGERGPTGAGAENTRDLEDTRDPLPAHTEMESALARAEARAAELEDRWLRLAADFENFRKRAAREERQAAARSADTALTAVIRVVDDLERAVEAAREKPATAESLREGLELVLAHARAALADRGVEVVNPLGARFDPAEHEAVLRNPGGEPNTVTRVIAHGYRRGGRVIRPAQVEVGG